MKWLIIIVGTAAGLYGLYLLGYPSYSYRFRITLDVETVDGLKTGSSVLEVTTIQYPSWVTLGANDHQTTVRGEAVFVDLGSGRNVIALLALNPHAQDGRSTLFAPRSFFPVIEGVPLDLKWSKDLSTMRGRRAYAGNRSPTLVTFSYLNDPASVREVPFENVGSVLGPDMRSVRAWIELTTDPVTNILETKLPWISKFESANIAWRIVTRGQRGSSSPLEIFRRK